MDIFIACILGFVVIGGLIYLVEGESWDKEHVNPKAEIMRNSYRDRRFK